MIRPKVVWLADVPGWAYHNRMRRVSTSLPAYDHVVVFDIVRNYQQAINEMGTADVIVCPDPRLLPLVAWRDNVALNLNAIKIFL